MKCCRICNQGRLLALALAFHHSAALALLPRPSSSPSLPFPFLTLSPASPFPSFPPPLPHHAAVVPGEHKSFRNRITGPIQVDDASTLSLPKRFFTGPLAGQCHYSFLPSLPSLPFCRGPTVSHQPVNRSTPFEDTFPLFFKHFRILPLESQCQWSLSLTASKASLRLQRKCDPLQNRLRGLPGPGFSACFRTTWFHGLMAPRCVG